MRRREFVGRMGSCAAWVAAVLAAGTPATRRAFAARPRGRVVAREPWGRLEEVAEGAWALISTPLEEHPRAHLTVANGGIVAGRDGVALIEGLVSEPGARWLADAARELTGRSPDHVVLTHYHGDHSNGLPAHGAAADADSAGGRTTGGTGPSLHTTAPTLETLRRGDASRDREPVTAGYSGDRLRLAVPDGTARIDLGGRVLEIHGTSGHTHSDLFVVLEEPRIVWCGDLVWNGLFPNYVDAIPSRLSESVRQVARDRATIWVPGHGDLADRAAIERYTALIDDVEEAAQRAHEAGRSATEAAAGYRPPAALGEWVMFSPRYYELAFEAWDREMGDDEEL